MKMLKNMFEIILLILIIYAMWCCNNTVLAVESYSGIVNIEIPQEGKSFNETIRVNGWALSDDINAVVQVLIDGKDAGEVARYTRNDVFRVFGSQYGGRETNPTPGFNIDIDISNIKDGNHIITVKIKSDNDQIIASTSRNVKISRKHESRMNLEMPRNNQKIMTSVKVNGWALSDDVNAGIQVLIDGKDAGKAARYTRNDVFRVFGSQYGGRETNPTPGFNMDIDVSNLKQGEHIVTVNLISGTGELLSYDTRKIILLQEYESLLNIEIPANNQNTTTSVKVNGWVLSEYKNANIEIYLDGEKVDKKVARYTRNDVFRVFGSRYGGRETNPTPGFDIDIDVSYINDGLHTLVVKVVTDNGKILTSSQKNIIVKKYEAILNLESPKDNYETKESIKVNGWTLSDDKDAVIQVLIDGKDAGKVTRYTRNDVFRVFGSQYGGRVTNQTPGFNLDVDISNIKNGKHIITVKLLTKKDEVLAQTSVQVIVNKIYTGRLNIEEPSDNKQVKQSIKVNGWALSDDKEDKIVVLLNGKIIGEATRYTRNDVFRVFGNEYGGKEKNQMPGFSIDISTMSIKSGNYTLTVQVLSKFNEIITSQSRLLYIYSDIYHGIDVSKWNGDIDWTNVKKQGIDFAIARVGYGREAYQKDATFEANYSGAKSVGIKVGTYLYSYAKDVEGAKLEAYNCLNWLNGRELDLPVFYDLEDNSQAGLDKQVITDMAKAFCEIIHNAGYKVGVYANKYWLQDKIDVSQLPEYCDVWLAHYTGTSDPMNQPSDYVGKYQMWQYTSTGSVSGIQGDVDMNLCYKKY